MSYSDDNESEREHQPNEAEVSAQKEMILKKILDSSARMRLGNIKMVKPDLAGMVEDYLIGMATQGRIRTQITDDQFKKILASIQQPKREFKINRR